MRELVLLISVELKEYIREPGVIFWAMLFPILLALGLGMAFSGSGNQVRTVAVVCEGSCEKNWNPRKIGNEKLGYTSYEFVKTSREETELMLKQGKSALIVEEIPDGEISFHFDPANMDARLSYNQLSSELNNIRLDDSRIEVLQQKGTRYVDFLIPGLMAMGIMMSCMWGIGYSNVDKRSKKLLRRMVATPMKKYNYVASQLAGRLIMSALESTLLVSISMWVFGIEISGSLTGLLFMFIAGNIFFVGLGWLVASRTSKPQIANGLINLVIMPMLILSGVYFSYHNFPDAMVAVIQFLPLTILADSIRSIFIEGAGFSAILDDFLALSLTGIILLSLGIRVYRWY